MKAIFKQTQASELIIMSDLDTPFGCRYAKYVQRGEAKRHIPSPVSYAKSSVG